MDRRLEGSEKWRMATTQVKYKNIYEQIKGKILDSTYVINEMLPNTDTLAKEHSVSSLTIKKALDMLVRDGYIVRRRGSGTVVQDWKQQQKHSSSFEPLTGASAKYKEGLRSEVLEFSVQNADEFIAHKLAITVGDFVYKIVRLRLLNNEPLVMEHTYMPIALIPGLDKNVLEHSIYSHIKESLNLRIGTSVVRVKSIRPLPLEKKYMNLKDTDFLTRVEQVAYLADGRTFEYSCADHVPETFEFEAVFTAKN